MKKTVATPLAPAAVGPYSQAVVAGNTIYVSGQLPLTPLPANLLGRVREQLHQIFKTSDIFLKKQDMTF